MNNLYVTASPVGPFVLMILNENEETILTDSCFMSDLIDKVMIYDKQYDIDHNYLIGNQQYIEQLVDIFSELRFELL
jgi:hypothetical protein